MPRMLVVAVLLAACGGGKQEASEPKTTTTAQPLSNTQPDTPPPPPATPEEQSMAAMEEFTAKFCACKDKACAEAVVAEMTTWSQAMAKEHQHGLKVSEEDSKRASELAQRMNECVQKAMSGGASKP